MRLTYKFAGAVAACALVGSMLAPSAFASTDPNHHHGSSNTTNCTVVQNSSTSVFNGIGASSNTGGNKANFNHGSVTIGTGNAVTGVGVGVAGGGNTANNPCCACQTVAPETGNTNSTTTIVQGSSTTVTNLIGASSNTGGNTASFNTSKHGGPVVIGTGDSTTSVSVSVTGGSNIIN